MRKSLVVGSTLAALTTAYLVKRWLSRKPTFRAAIVLGIAPVSGRLLPQVHACLAEAARMLRAGEADVIVLLGGRGHGVKIKEQPVPESEMMRDYLVEKWEIPKEKLILNGVPTTTQAVCWELKGVAARYHLTSGCIVTIRERRERIAFLAGKIVGPALPLKVKAINYRLLDSEQHTVTHEAYLLTEAKRVLKHVRPGSDVGFCRVYTFREGQWQYFAEQQEAEKKQ